MNMQTDTQVLSYNLALHLGDNSIIMGHRLSEWTGHGPSLEQDIALTNMALDLIGQARYFYQYAATIASDIEKKNITEDDLAYLRDAREFRNFLITEIPNGDWGKTILKLFLFSNWQLLAYEQLIKDGDPSLAAIAEKALKEIAYHVKWSSEWVIRLGDGTEESHERMQKAIEELWPYTGEMFELPQNENQTELNRTCITVSNHYEVWKIKIKDVFEKATLTFPSEKIWMQSGGKSGMHTEHLGYLLAEMQFLQRAYPGCEW